MQKQGVRLIVIDSIASLYRAEFEANEMNIRAQLLRELAGQLRIISSKYAVPVLVINQVSDLVEERLHFNSYKQHWSVVSSGRRVIPTLGLTWASCINTRLALSRQESSTTVAKVGSEIQRSMHVIFSPCAPQGSCPFVVDSEGLRGVGSDL